MDYKSELKKRIILLRKNPASLYNDPENTLNALYITLKNINPWLADKILSTIKSKNFSTKMLDNLITEIYLNFINIDEPTFFSEINTPIEKIKGVGDKLKETLHSLNIKTINELLLFFPDRYEYISSGTSFDKKILIGQYHFHEYVKSKFGKSYLFVTFKTDNNKTFAGVWFNFNKKYPLPFLQSQERLNLYGEVKNFRGIMGIVHPEFVNDEEIDKIRVRYPVGSKIKNKTFAKLIKTAYENYSETIFDTLPFFIVDKYKFPHIRESLKGIHFPDNPSIVSQLNSFNSIYHKRFIYEELFYLQLGFIIKKHSYQKNNGIIFKIDNTFLEKIKPYIPFKLTASQKRVLSDIFNDMKSQNQMNRLIQGDVGSGKTIVAFIAALVAILNGYQVTVIAPTEILAEQHFLNFNKLMGNSFKSVLLTSSVKKSEKQLIKNKIKENSVDFIFGTHAIIQDDVEFKNLGLAIIDEQHRFGVLQRKALCDKGINPDILLMSATPIPRTLALTLYGDLDVSTIDELPPGRRPVETRAFNEKESQTILKFMKNEILKGNQVYVVYPLIEESENLDLKAAVTGYEKLSNVFGKDNIGLLHGKMKSDEKRIIMEKFKNKEIKILVSTTVIEVGVDVPDATVMVIQNAERFGIAQLHQLRGRIGRSDKNSYCYLIYSDKIGEDGLKRIKAMEKYSDGFKLAEIDLEMRGPGDFFGVRQSGLPTFKFSNIVRDYKILVDAREDALKIVENDPYLEKPEHKILKQVLLEKWKNEIDLIKVG
ncbi:MAG: recG [Deferribacteraceae bacterium]|nr:recG [Deferribacteraceae bacterium]